MSSNPHEGGGLSSRSARLLALLSCLFLLQSAVFSKAQIRISEFMAENDSTLIDDDDDRSDWIELHNPTSSPVSLSGWHLTDDPLDPVRWTFPDVNIAAGQHMVVFASGKDRTQPGAPLHTNFRLSNDGDYLALIEPDGTSIASEFAPMFPLQRGDVSYGFGNPETVETPILPSNVTARALIPSNGNLGLSWVETGFNDSSWQSGSLGVGYDYGGLIGLDVGAMRNVNESVYIRIPFNLASVPDIDRLILRVLFEDGMVAYLNGDEIARENAPENVDWDSGAPGSRDDSIAVVPFDIDITSAIDLLQPGENVLAFHGLNYLLTSSDFLMLPELIGVSNLEGEITEGYFPVPTPGEVNVNAVAAVLAKPVFSVLRWSIPCRFST